MPYKLTVIIKHTHPPTHTHTKRATPIAYVLLVYGTAMHPPQAKRVHAYSALHARVQATDREPIVWIQCTCMGNTEGLRPRPPCRRGTSLQHHRWTWLQEARLAHSLIPARDCFKVVRSWHANYSTDTDSALSRLSGLCLTQLALIRQKC